MHGMDPCRTYIGLLGESGPAVVHILALWIVAGEAAWFLGLNQRPGVIERLASPQMLRLPGAARSATLLVTHAEKRDAA
jgi:hypothetical protein